MVKETKFLAYGLSIISVALMLHGCAPEVGSPEWCKDMKSKPSGEWTANEMADFTRQCLFKPAG